MTVHKEAVMLGKVFERFVDHSPFGDGAGHTGARLGG
jgi:hypothetical protein